MSDQLHIIKIESQKMTLSDNSEWLFWPGAEPKSTWEFNDRIEKGREGKFSIEFINLELGIRQQKKCCIQKMKNIRNRVMFFHGWKKDNQLKLCSSPD